VAWDVAPSSLLEPPLLVWLFLFLYERSFSLRYQRRRRFRVAVQITSRHVTSEPGVIDSVVFLLTSGLAELPGTSKPAARRT